MIVAFFFLRGNENVEVVCEFEGWSDTNEKKFTKCNGVEGT